MLPLFSLHTIEYYHETVSLDTEWCLPTEHNVDQKVAILQLSIDQRCLVFQLYHADYIPHSLRSSWQRAYTFVRKGVKQDAEKLLEDYVLRVAKTKDVGYWAAKKYGDRDIRRMGLKALVCEFLQKLIKKPRQITMSKWDDEQLTDPEVEYACLDAFVSYMLGVFLTLPRPEILYLEYLDNPESQNKKPVLQYDEFMYTLDPEIRKYAMPYLDYIRSLGSN